MIFSLYSHVVLKLGDERYEFSRDSLMFSEVVALENASGYSFGEWQSDLGRHSLRAVGALLHVLRQRAGVASDFETMNFAAHDLDVVPLHDDGTEFTADEVAEDITRRLEEAKDPPTSAASPAAPAGSSEATGSTSRTSPSGSASAPGSGAISPRGRSSGSRQRPTKN